jgi:hypothetical protein
VQEELVAYQILAYKEVVATLLISQLLAEVAVV